MPERAPAARGLDEAEQRRHRRGRLRLLRLYGLGARRGASEPN
ncbi:MAG: hypothetical protein U1F37_02750 [Alphaproteobacteria bacterium]